jgi:hypothetical protein
VAVPQRFIQGRGRMAKYLASILLAAVCGSCAAETTAPRQDIWSLAIADPGLTEVYLGGHSSLQNCKEAGVSWLNRSHDKTYALECRLNCRKTTSETPAVCEAVEPVL